MSNRYTGGIISATPPTLVAGAGASGAWTLEQQMQATAAGLWPQNGPFFVEDVFSTWLYTGNGSTQTITNGIDLAGKGGLVWIKSRSNAVANILTDTVRGNNNILQSNSTSAQLNTTASVNAFNSNGFTVGGGASFQAVNFSGFTYASWTFREQPKFFDVVTYTGDGTSNRAINHNLGSVPGCILLKRTDSETSWFVYHRATPGTPQDNILQLNTSDAMSTSAGYWGTTPFTDTQFRVSGFGGFNASGGTYVAYVFAHNAGGFGLSGTDNVISCGSCLGSSSVNLGYEPQWVLVKAATTTQDWYLFDTMRGLTASVPSSTETGAYVFPNTNAAEASFSNGLCSITATGFDLDISSIQTYIYIAIRRGPMKVPTTGTSVFAPVLWTGNNGASRVLSGIGFPPDFANLIRRPGNNPGSGFYDRLRGAPVLITGGSAANQTESYWANTDTDMGAYGQNSLTLPTNAAQWNANSVTYVGEFFRRAPGFFDEVCYTGTGANTTQAHNLGVAPELMIVKGRYFSTDWQVYSSALANTEYLVLNTTDAKATGATRWNSTTPTSSVFSLGTAIEVNYSAPFTYVAYLFASAPGVSKVGSYTGTGATQVINCGFTGGARYVLIKSTSTTGNWLVWDSARGIVAGNDPYLALNSTAAEVTNTDWVDTAATGFELSNAGGNLANSNGVSYIFLAIA